MEDRTIIREKHGIANARRISAASIEHSEIQSVMLTDGDGEIFLSLGASTFPAGLTPAQAGLLAKQLVSAAARARRLARKPA